MVKTVPKPVVLERDDELSATFSVDEWQTMSAFVEIPDHLVARLINLAAFIHGQRLDAIARSQDE